MDLVSTKNLAQKLLNQHGLVDWHFGYESNIKLIGACYHKHKLIVLNWCYCKWYDEELLTEVLLHEIAHALLPYNHWHTITWLNKAIQLGCDYDFSIRCFNLDKNNGIKLLRKRISNVTIKLLSHRKYETTYTNN